MITDRNGKTTARVSGQLAVSRALGDFILAPLCFGRTANSWPISHSSRQQNDRKFLNLSL